MKMPHHNDSFHLQHFFFLRFLRSSLSKKYDYFTRFLSLFSGFQTQSFICPQHNLFTITVYGFTLIISQ